MRSPRLDCSSFFVDGVLVRCNSLRVLDEHCRLRLVSSCYVLHRQSHLSAIAVEQVQRSARLLHLQLCAIVQGNKLVSSGAKGQQICLAVPPKVMRDCLLQSTCLERHISFTSGWRCIASGCQGIGMESLFHSMFLFLR
ncbi:uncharacterized protein [Triticum aestivum]|uniref:uncharacterized protein n=1 Tax=Triticum aestivum TaxID=4565 RepID=UPI001D02CF01|nr:uncharacterized protein LOC123154267 [Triticum aestivum]